MQQNECRDWQFLLIEPGLEPVRSFSVVKTPCECIHAALRSELLPASVGGWVHRWGRVPRLGGAGSGWLELLDSSDVPLVQSKREFLKERKQWCALPWTLFAAAGKKCKKVEKSGKNSFTTKYRWNLYKTCIKLFYFLHWIIIKC